MNNKRKNYVSSILMALSVIGGIVPVFFIMEIIKMLIDNRVSSEMIFKYSFLICLCLGLKAIFYGLAVWTAHQAAYSVLADIRNDMITHFKKMPFAFFQKRKTGDLANIINHEVEQIELYLAHALPDIVAATLIPLVIFVVVLILDWRLGLALVCLVPLVFLYMNFLNKMWADKIKKYNDSVKKMSEDLLEYIATISVVKAFNKDENRTKRVLDSMYDYIAWVRKMTSSISIPMSIVGILLESGIIVLAIVGSVLLVNNAIKVDTLILAIILGGIFVSAFARLMTFQHFKIIYEKATESINSVLLLKPEERKDIYKSVQNGDIEFKNISFSYDGEKKVLENINLMFKENSVNAIVGSSGSGKSTIAHLLMGFWKADEGSIMIAGKNIDEMTERALSGLVSIVQQDVFLFNGSIKENIRMGRTDAVMEDIIEAAKKAQIHDFIAGLTEGYDTVVGEGGAKLSGGEKQRISIARMILKNAPIIILDEATAAIDPYNEYLIQKAINELSVNKTLIVIAHHLNTIRTADQIIVMENGKISARGMHKELMANSVLYKRMCLEQEMVDNWEVKGVAS